MAFALWVAELVVKSTDQRSCYKRKYTRTKENSVADPVVGALILDLVEWLASGERRYEEVMDAWRTSCPRLPVWEDANDRGLVETEYVDGRSVVRATPSGLALLERHKESKGQGSRKTPK